MKEFVLASTNEAKRRATLAIIMEVFGAGNVLKALDIPSTVSPTPMSHEECIQGAKDRVTAAKQAEPHADYYIGAEGGLAVIAGVYFIGGWVVVENAAGEQHLASSAWVEMPAFLHEYINPHTRLSEYITAEHFPTELYERRDRLGTNGLITQGVYTRVNEFYDALNIAFSLFKKEAS